MTESSGQRHVYLRQMAQGERTSLSVLAGMVAAGARVLDLGTGSGALGTFLSEQRGCTVDGLTISAEEAALAGPGYRRVEVADLESADWPERFGGERYDYVICADVLEHLREPERVLAACQRLLAPGGQLLVSVPNAAYSGLVAELLHGDFRYRPEGLLDRTHLRFFTRRTITQLLADGGFDVQGVEPVERPLNESEFRQRFDDLPPAVSRYVLSLPDAGTYQLVLRARLGSAAPAPVPQALAPTAQALFTAQLYCATAEGYSEARKTSTAGVVGEPHQLLRFPVPAQTVRLRLDPADRPGYVRLHRMRLVARDGVRWEWTGDADGMRALEGCVRRQMLVGPAAPATTGLVLLHGDDPWIELPIAEGVLPLAEDATLEVELGWPMSADYLALSTTVQPLAERIQHLQGQLAEVREGFQSLEGYMRTLEDHVRLAQAQAQRAQEDTAQERARRTEADAQRQLAETLRGHAMHALAEKQAELDRFTRESAQALAETRARADARERELGDDLAKVRHRHAEQSLELRRTTQDKIQAQHELAALQLQFEQLASHLRWIENSTVFRATRPLVRAKMALDRLLGRSRPAPPAPVALEQRIEPPAAPVDVIVPVYRGLDDTRCCIESVLAAPCQTPWRLVVLNDASPEPEVTQWLRDKAAREPRMLLLENEHNLGFVGTVNRGMALSETNDVVLVNSDAEVANDWLDRLRSAAYRDARVASVTPFSNNATICSYPKFCEANELPPGETTASLDQAFAQANAGEAVDVPTGVGFCMYIRRDCLAEVGLFDVEQFGKGYGEENDFCRRAADAGWRNLHALDTFVRHAGGVSFGASKSQREIEAVEKLRRLHPTYDRIVHEYVQADPPRAARMRADIARVAQSGLPVVLAVRHNRAGGTIRHVSELADHLREQAAFFVLSPAPGSAVTLELLEPGSAFKLEFQVPGQWDSLLESLRAIGVAHVHYHHLIGHSDLVLGLAERLGVSWDFTAHDYFPMCPNISLTGQDDRYCGEDGSGSCQRCAGSAPEGDLAAWRGKHGPLITGARAVLAPSADTARRYARMWPQARIRVAPHTDIASPADLPKPQVAARGDNARLKVAILGGLSRIKGADVVEDVAVRTSAGGAALEFHLLGHAYRNLHTQPQAALTVHGQYQEADLPRLLEWLKPDVVWFPAQWPETYSYTLSACLEAGLPVVVTDLGAFAERLNGRRWSWVERWDQPAQHWVDFFDRIRQDHFARGQSPAPLFIAGNGGEASFAPWVHSRDYLAGIASQPTTALPHSVLQPGGPAHASGAGVQSAAGLKGLALSSLVRLRSTRGFRRVARAIPSHVQRRVKNWLLA